eukprot:jgi/Mesen1/6928/ME000036S06256
MKVRDLFKWWNDPITRTLVLVNVAAIVEKADEALLPAVYKEVGTSFNVTPSALGTLTLVRALMQALSFPLAVFMALRHDRVYVIAVGALVWGIATSAVGFAVTYFQVVVARALNGVGLALVIPAIQALVADSAPPEARGVAFGWLQLVSNVGSILGGACGVLFAGHRMLGMDGWRAAFHLVAAVSYAVAALLYFCATDPTSSAAPSRRQKRAARREERQLDVISSSAISTTTIGASSTISIGGSNASSRSSSGRMQHAALQQEELEDELQHPRQELERQQQHQEQEQRRRQEQQQQQELPSWRETLAELYEGARRVMRVPTFRIIVAQGVVGSFPWSALAFGAMWLELLGFGHADTALLLGAFSVASSLGSLFGGWMGDTLTRAFPDSGRIMCAQFSSAVAVPLATILLRLLPQDPSWGWLYALVLAIMGFFISWNAAATNNPIFAEIVPEELRTSVYALDRTFEMSLAAFAPPVVGLLTERVYGFIPPHKGDDVQRQLSNNRANAGALAKGLYATIVVPFILCCGIYTLMYWTYPRDRDAAKRDAGLSARTCKVDVQLEDVEVVAEGGDGRDGDADEHRRLLAGGQSTVGELASGGQR